MRAAPLTPALVPMAAIVAEAPRLQGSHSGDGQVRADMRALPGTASLVIGLRVR